MKKLFRIHFAAIVVSDLLLLVTFRPRYELSLERGLIFCFIFILAQGLLLSRLVFRLKKHFSEIYPQMNKKIRLYYLGVLTIDFLLFVLLAFTSSQRFSSLMPIVTSWHSTFYYLTASHLRENYPDFYNKHIAFWECL
ncbi:hypothetical protein [Streptococcus oralis]|uniref:hypothetical protein n=1 Tax=Streptococcus oralis TaxID=1303 RepID=UPI000A0F67E2|nr:hypothetical protein [Streptococcus oralis]MCY7090160.1 hypothetical protein [Streptococcus oralis]ORO84636.1 hypothetical protein B7706_01900 [Streptococcus oralis subsp. dentisani]